MTKPTTSKLAADQSRWLLSKEADELLQRTVIMQTQGADVAKIVKQLRQQTSADNTHLVISQIRLRERARKKFRLADNMFFTEQGLEQSSGDLLAGYKANRLNEFFSISRDGAPRVCDLCVGIGGDAMAIAATTENVLVTGVDSDAATANFAEHNLRLAESNLGRAENDLGLLQDELQLREQAGESEPRTRVIVADVNSIDVSNYDAWHLDPDQRATGHRSRSADSLCPGLDTVTEYLRTNRNGCVKLSPMTKVSASWLQANGPIEIEYLGDGRECKQQLLWFGPWVPENRIRATVVRRCAKRTFDFRSAVVTSIVRDVHDDWTPKGDATPADVHQPLKEFFIYEPHATVIAADLVDSLATELDLKRIDSSVAYLCGERLISHPTLAAFKIVEVSNADGKHIRRMMQKHDARIVEWKKRGVDHRLMDSFRKLKAGGNVPHTLFVTKASGCRKAILAKRVSAV